MSSKSSKSPKVQTESFFVVGEKIGPKRKQNCKKKNQWQNLNPRRRAFVKKERKGERTGVVSKTVQEEEEGSIIRGMVRREYTKNI